jgi:hypothetical protein
MHHYYPHMSSSDPQSFGRGMTVMDETANPCRVAVGESNRGPVRVLVAVFAGHCRPDVVDDLVRFVFCDLDEFV